VGRVNGPRRPDARGVDFPTLVSPSLVAVLAGAVVAMAGVGAFLQASLGGPGTTEFVVRVLLVAVAIVGAVLLALALRTRLGGAEVDHPASPG
jgi:hypothetical protein